MNTNNFFEETTEQSEVKKTIVSKYFWAWAKVILHSVKKRGRHLAYIDLFAGPGRYKDGAKSIPLLVLEKAIEDKDMQEMLVTVFNDKDSDNTHSLEKEINSLPGIKKLEHTPQVLNQEVGVEIVKMFEKMRLVPTLFFVDPWGYKGLSLRLINSVLKNWGCDCIFFFNYNRINMGLSNPFVKDHMDILFGEERADQLRQKLEKLDAEQRELTIIEELAQALKDMGGKFVLPFRFKNKQGNRTSHHLIFVSKNFKGYTIMKSIMAKESSLADQGVPSFEYNPADERYPTLFELSRPLDDLEELVSKEYQGKNLTVKQIYIEHSVDKPYIEKNYKDVLRKMELSGKIHADPPLEKRRKYKGVVTMADSVKITFKEGGR